MKLVSKAALLGALILPMVAAPASAQTWKFDFSLGGGYAWYSSFLDDEDFPGLGADNSVKFSSSPFLGAQFGFWPGNWGLRLNATYADTELGSDDFTFHDNVNLWSGTGDVMFRFARPRDDYSGMEILPYAALGLGLKWMNPAGAGSACVDTEGDTGDCTPLTAGTTTLAMKEGSTLMGLLGLGADWRIARSFAIRTEIGDRLWDPKVHVATASGTGFVISDEDVGSMIHELYAQVGLNFLFGIARPAEVAVAPAPMPPPPPPAAPEIRREAISVCVVDPTAPGGIRMQSATLIEGRDTVVTVNGTERRLGDAMGNVMVASNADWYVRGQPLTMNIGNQKVEFATYGSARTIEASELAFLGTVNGVPVYADRDEVADVIEELNELNRAQSGRDLGKILEEHKDLRQDLDDVKVVYVPLYATGCVFQGVQRQEEVRKGGK
ncbi:MAG TPA: outer membrane beta-barrel protein [Longimicrobiales bacterium]